MKKLFHFSSGAVLPSLALVLGLIFWSATGAIVQGQTSQIAETPERPDKPGKGGKAGKDPGKCDVCHNPHNYHTVSIPCSQVDQFLANHPGDFRGRCQATPVQNP